MERIVLVQIESLALGSLSAILGSEIHELLNNQHAGCLQDGIGSQCTFFIVIFAKRCDLVCTEYAIYLTFQEFLSLRSLIRITYRKLRYNEYLGSKFIDLFAPDHTGIYNKIKLKNKLDIEGLNTFNAVAQEASFVQDYFTNKFCLKHAILLH